MCPGIEWKPLTVYLKNLLVQAFYLAYISNSFQVIAPIFEQFYSVLILYFFLSWNSNSRMYIDFF